MAESAIRKASIERATKETQIKLALDLDGAGRAAALIVDWTEHGFGTEAGLARR